MIFPRRILFSILDTKDNRKANATQVQRVKRVEGKRGRERGKHSNLSVRVSQVSKAVHSSVAIRNTFFENE